jgi:hypothetical protein
MRAPSLVLRARNASGEWGITVGYGGRRRPCPPPEGPGFVVFQLGRRQRNAFDNEIFRQLGKSRGPTESRQSKNGKSVVHDGGGNNPIAIPAQ